MLVDPHPERFLFIAEEKLSHIFAVLAQYKLKLNLMQNSAISFSFCVDCNSAVFNEFLDQPGKNSRYATTKT